MACLKSVCRMLAAFVLCLIMASPSYAVVLTFEGLGDQESVGNYYNGGTSQAGNTGGDYGIVFSDNSLVSIDSDAGGEGNFGHEPSPSTALFFLEGAAAIMNVVNGFETGFSFFYSAIMEPGSVEVWSGVGATGTLLASLTLDVTPRDGGDPTGAFSPFVPLGVSFNGIAHSVSFGGVQNSIGFDNITLGAAEPQVTQTPEPSTMLLFGIGMLGCVGYARRRNAG